MEDLAAIFQLSHKNHNRLQKAYNGNGQLNLNGTQKCQPPVRDTAGLLQGPHPTVLGVGVPDGGLARPSKFKVIHWNAGSKLWENKLDIIENLLSDKKPDLCFISEANLWSHVPNYQTVIPDHHLILPSTMKSLNHARLVLIVRDGVNIHILKEHMDPDIAAIWVKIASTKKRSVVVGGVYREHLQLGTEDTNLTFMEKLTRQEIRWKKIVNRWNLIGKSADCFVIGDLNLDFFHWLDPVQHHENMIELTKDVIETGGFEQIITGFTRQAPHQDDSLIDHVWTNCAQKSIRHFNEVRDPSDHNVIGCDILKKDLKIGGQNILKRLWKIFNKEDVLGNLNKLIGPQS